MWQAFGGRGITNTVIIVSSIFSNMLNIVFYSILLQNICFLNGVFDIYSFRSIGLIDVPLLSEIKQVS